MKIARQECCVEEGTQQSEHSPGVVEDQERLARFIYTEHHVDDETGELKAGAFPLDDLMEARRQGISLWRLGYMTLDELRKRGRAFEEAGNGRRFRGIGCGQTIDVRELNDDLGVRALCVIDDGLPDGPAHVLAVRSADQNRSALKKVRGRLLDIFSPVKAPEDAFTP